MEAKNLPFCNREQCRVHFSTWNAEQTEATPCQQKLNEAKTSLDISNIAKWYLSVQNKNIALHTIFPVLFHYVYNIYASHVVCSCGSEIAAVEKLEVFSYPEFLKVVLRLKTVPGKAYLAK